MTTPRAIPPEEEPFPAFPAWNEKALVQFVAYIRDHAGGAFADEDEQDESGDRAGYRWALRRLALAGRLRVRRRVGRRVEYEIVP